MQFFGIVFIISTTLVLVLKKETDQSKDADQEPLESTLSTRAMFSLLLKIVKLEPVQKLLILLFTCKVYNYFNRQMSWTQIGFGIFR